MNPEVPRPVHSNSSAPVSLLEKVAYNSRLFFMRLRGGNEGEHNALQRMEELRSLVSDFERETGRLAAESSVVEIGFGARPERAFAMTAFFRVVTAIDLDAPVLSIKDIPRVVRRNGLERGLKSAVRHTLFDARGWRSFHRAMQKACSTYDPARARLIVGDAGDPETWRKVGQVDLVFSSDVFEHIPGDFLPPLVRQLRQRLLPGGMVVVRPMVFTGVSGGHDLAWYPHQVERNDSSSAWGHLLDHNFQTNTYLNKLSRSDFRSLFEREGFIVMRDEALLGRLGERHLTPERKAALASFDDYELFSNRVDFWLR